MKLLGTICIELHQRASFFLEFSISTLWISIRGAINSQRENDMCSANFQRDGLGIFNQSFVSGDEPASGVSNQAELSVNVCESRDVQIVHSATGK